MRKKNKQEQLKNVKSFQNTFSLSRLIFDYWYVQKATYNIIFIMTNLNQMIYANHQSIKQKFVESLMHGMADLNWLNWIM